jgi:hypothetical protein
MNINTEFGESTPFNSLEGEFDALSSSLNLINNFDSLSSLEIPNPTTPTVGEQNLLELINGLPLSELYYPNATPQEGDLIDADNEDRLRGTDNGEQMFGLSGDDRMRGRDGDDILFGGPGDDDRIRGDRGNDTLIGGSGDDDLFGDDGSDTFVLAPGDGTDTIRDFELDEEDQFLLTDGLLFEDLDFVSDQILFGDEVLAEVRGLDTTSLTFEDFSIPFTVIAQAGDSAPVIKNGNLGQSSIQLNVDNDNSTGQAGNGFDIEVGVKAELLPEAGLELEIERLGNASFVEDLTVLVAFPFDAFNDEVLPGSPNLFMGFQTTAANGLEGGYAPLKETIEFIPGILGGTDHAFEIQFNTLGSDNPLEFLAGHFDDENLTDILNYSAISTFVETDDNTVPETISLGLDIDNSFPFGSPLNTSFGLTWEASEVADVVFKQIEDESNTTGTPDFGTAVAVRSMPTQETLEFSLSENPGFTLSHRGNSEIDELTLLHEREDGLTILGKATDIPTEVDLFIDPDATNIALDVNANTLDLQVELIKENSFLNTSNVLGFDLGYLSVAVEDAPDLTAGFNAANKSFSATATNPGESIGKIEVVADDDANYVDDEFTNLEGLELAPSWNDEPEHHIFSWVEDGTQGTAAARLVHLEEATLDLDATDLTQTFNIVTTEAAPLQAYLKFGEGSNVISGNPNPDIEVTVDIDDIPAGAIDFTYESSTNFSQTINLPVGIDSVRTFGHIDTLNFDFELLDLPSQVAFSLDPESGATLVMNDSLGGISANVASDNQILGSDYRFIDVNVTDIPANWVANWGGDGFLIESNDTANNPQAMGTLSALISTSNNPEENQQKIEPFTLDGPLQTGAILSGTAGGSRINYSPFLQEIDNRYYGEESPSVLPRLRDLYAGSEELDPGEDHVIVRLENNKVDFASLQFTGFQKIAWVPDENGGNFTFRAPSPGTHPLFAGFEDGDFTTLQIENVPDEIVVDINDTGSITYNATDDANPSAGQIDLYRGPLPIASDSDSAIRAIMNDTPESVDINWNFGFPDGAINFDASNEFEMLFLTQNGNRRITAGLEMEDLQLGYDIDLFPLDLDIDGPSLFPPEVGSADLRLLSAKAGIDNDANSSNINANFAKPGTDGFFTLYDLKGSPVALINGTAPDGSEYVPLITAMMRDFRELSATVALDVELAKLSVIPAPPFVFPTLTLEPEVDVDVDLEGDVVFDVWSSANTDATFDIFGFDFGFRNQPDYRDNTPIHIIPLESPDIDRVEDAVFTFNGLHGFGSHFDPFV